MMSHCPCCTLYQWEEKSDEPLLRCSLCKAVRYCSKDCQKEHWEKQHKVQCKKMRATPELPEHIQDAYATGDLASVMKFFRETPDYAKKLAKSVMQKELHVPFNCSTCQQVAKLGSEINSKADPHWGCLLGPLSSTIELRDLAQEISSEEYTLAKLPFTMGEQTGEFTSRYEQTLSLMQRVLHKMYLTSHPLVADDARLRSMFQYIGGIRSELLGLAVESPPGQILEYFHQDQIGNSKLYRHLLELVYEMTKEFSTEEDGPYKLWKTFQILVFFCLHLSHADRVLFEELGKQVNDETLAAALNKNESAEKFNLKRVAVLEGLEKGMMPFTYLLNILCDGNQHKICGTCNSSIFVEDIVFPSFVQRSLQTPSKPSLLCFCGVSTFSCSSISCFETSWENTTSLAMTLQTIYHHFALKSTPNRCDMCFKFSKKVHRCDRCLTKVYCSEECRDQDWSLVHKDLCKKEQDGRKMKGGSKERKNIGKEFMKDYIRDLRLNERCDGLAEEDRLRRIIKSTSEKLVRQLM